MNRTRRLPRGRARTLVALLVLALLATLLVACGGSSSGGGSGDAQSLLKQAFDGSQKIKSGKAVVKIGVNVQGGSGTLKGPIDIGISGPFQTGATGTVPKFDLALNAALQGQSFQAGLTSTADNLYVTFAGSSYQVPATLMSQLQQSLKQTQQGTTTTPKLSLSSLHVHPLGWLKDTKVVGDETVGGAATQHVSGQLDVSAVLDDFDKILAGIGDKGLLSQTGQTLPHAIPAKVRAQIQQAVKSGTIDVWVGKDDKLLHKLALGLSLAPKSATGPKQIDLSLSFEIDDLNQPQTITAPANVKPLSDLLGQFGGLLGGLGGSGGGGGGLGGLLGGAGGSGAGGGSGTPNSAQLQKYTACLRAAGSDVAKATQCAQLLTK